MGLSWQSLPKLFCKKQAFSLSVAIPGRKILTIVWAASEELLYFFYFPRGEFICFVSPPPNNLIQINGAVPKTFCPSCCGETDIVMDPNPGNNRKRYTCIFNFLPVLVLPGQRLPLPPRLDVPQGQHHGPHQWAPRCWGPAVSHWEQKSQQQIYIFLISNEFT